MKTLTYLNNHPIFNRFNSALKDELQNSNIPVKVTKGVKPNTYVVSVDERDYNDSFKVLLNVRMKNGYTSLVKTLETKTNKRNR